MIVHILKSCTAATALGRSGFLSLAMLATLAGCGQMGGLYQPEPEAPETAQSLSPSSAKRGD